MKSTSLKIVIAAGGDGTRMNNITSGMPKSLLSFNSRPLISYQLEIFEQLGMLDVCLSFNTEEHIKTFKKIISKRLVPTNIKYTLNTHDPFDHPGKLFLSKQVQEYIKDSDFLYTQGDLVINPVLIRDMIDAFLNNNCFIVNKGNPRKNDKFEYIVKDHFIIEKKLVKEGETTWRDGGIYIIPEKLQKIWLDTFIKKPPLTPVFFDRCLKKNKKIFVLSNNGVFININTEKDYNIARDYLTGR